MESVLMIIIVASVIALIYVTKKSKALEKEDVTAESDAVQQEEEKSSGLPQTIIYKFSSKLENSVCPFCDGENRAGAEVCKICGKDL